MTTYDSGSELIRMVALCGGLTLLVFAACFINTYSAPITCDAGTYVVGQLASITCNFRTNISVSQQSFNMARYPSTAEKGAIGTDVLVCHWSDANYIHDCTVTYGYEFDNVITDQVTVEITETEEAFEGLYMCFFVPSQGKDTHACELSVRNTTLNDTTPVPQGGEDNTPTTAVAVALSLILLVLTIIIFAVLCIYWRRHKDKNPEEGGDTTPLLLKDIKIQEKGFELSTKNLKHLKNLLDQDMSEGLDESTKSQADVKMYPVLCLMPVGSGEKSKIVATEKAGAMKPGTMFQLGIVNHMTIHQDPRSGSDREGRKANIRNRCALTVSQEPPMARHFDVISVGLAGDWRRLGRAFGITDAQLDQIRMDFQYEGQHEINYRVLVKWKQQNPHPTLHFLAQTLLDIGRGDLADELSKG